MDWLVSHSPVIGLVFFFVFFLVMAVWAYRPANKEKLESNKYLPFAEDESHERPQQ
jgi:cbb3-type cytochrome oxidase subunit 3